MSSNDDTYCLAMLEALLTLNIITELEESCFGAINIFKIHLRHHPWDYDVSEISHLDTIPMDSVKCDLFREKILKEERLPKYILELAEKVVNGIITDIEFGEDNTGFLLGYKQLGIPFSQYANIGQRWKLYQYTFSAIKTMEKIDLV